MLDVKMLLNQVAYKKEVILKNLADLTGIFQTHSLNINMVPVLKVLDHQLDCLKFFEYLEQIDNVKTYYVQQGALHLVLHVDSNNFINYFFNDNNKDFFSFSCYADIPTKNEAFRLVAKELLSKLKLSYQVVLDVEQDQIKTNVVKPNQIQYNPEPMNYSIPVTPKPITTNTGYNADFKLPVDARASDMGFEEEDTSLRDLAMLNSLSGGIGNRDYTQPETSKGSVKANIGGKTVDLNRDYTS